MGSNDDVKTDLCHYFLIPTLKEIMSQGITNYIKSHDNAKDILIGLFKCIRYSVAESVEDMLMIFLQEFGLEFINTCKDIPDIRYEAYSLLCNLVKIELQLKPAISI